MAEPFIDVVDFIKDRFDPFTEAYSENSISDETQVIPNSSPFYVRTDEVVKQDSPSTIEIWSGAGKTGDQYTEVSGAPAVGEFQVDYKYNSGYIRFNETDKGKTVYITYKGIGSVIQAQHINIIKGDLESDGKVGTLKLTDASVSQAKLKSATGEVSFTTTSTTFVNSLITLPGGEYGLYSRIKLGISAPAGSDYYAYGDGILSKTPDSGEGDLALNSHQVSGWVYTAYKTFICLSVRSATSSSATAGVFANQRYITASGKDYWIFLLIAKKDILNEKEELQHKKGSIVASYQAPDHPCANQGGATEIEIPHPFGSYDPEKHEIVIVDNSILKDILPLENYKDTLLTLINEKCIIDDYKRPKFQPREIVQVNQFPHKPIGEVIDRFSIKKAIKTGLAPSGAEIFFRRDEVTKERRIIEKLPDNILFKEMRLKGKGDK